MTAPPLRPGGGEDAGGVVVVSGCLRARGVPLVQRSDGRANIDRETRKRLVPEEQIPVFNQQMIGGAPRTPMDTIAEWSMVAAVIVVFVIIGLLVIRG